MGFTDAPIICNSPLGFDAGNDFEGAASQSNTVCISDPALTWRSVTTELANQLAMFGEIARIDTSFMPTMKCLLVTYYDIRAAQHAIALLGGHCGPFPPNDDDFRTVRVTSEGVALVGANGGFKSFGDVANMAFKEGDFFIEYYDVRAARQLIAAAGGLASPAPTTLDMWVHHNMATTVSQLMHEDVSPTSPMLPPPTALTSARRQQQPIAMPKGLRQVSSETLPSISGSGGGSDSGSATGGSGSGGSGYAGSGPQRTKVTNKDFSKFDIHLDRIKRGEDMRTTVMVRNLTGPKAQKNFLNFLEVCGLADRYTFFYMPCKEHREVRAGFAFVNFKSPDDVRQLFEASKGKEWQEMHKGENGYKVLAMSYARFQGQKELMAHFSSSVVLRQQDLDKRPIFCAADAERAAAAAAAAAFETPRNFEPPPGLDGMQSASWSSLPSQEGLFGQQQDFELRSALSQGVNEIVALLSNLDGPCKSTVCSPSTACSADVNSLDSWSLSEPPEEFVGHGLTPQVMGA